MSTMATTMASGISKMGYVFTFTQLNPGTLCPPPDVSTEVRQRMLLSQCVILLRTRSCQRSQPHGTGSTGEVAILILPNNQRPTAFCNDTRSASLVHIAGQYRETSLQVSFELIKERGNLMRGNVCSLR